MYVKTWRFKFTCIPFESRCASSFVRASLACQVHKIYQSVELNHHQRKPWLFKWIRIAMIAGQKTDNMEPSFCCCEIITSDLRRQTKEFKRNDFQTQNYWNKSTYLRLLLLRLLLLLLPSKKKRKFYEQARTAELNRKSSLKSLENVTKCFSGSRAVDILKVTNWDSHFLLAVSLLPLQQLPQNRIVPVPGCPSDEKNNKAARSLLKRNLGCLASINCHEMSQVSRL